MTAQTHLHGIEVSARERLVKIRFELVADVVFDIDVQLQAMDSDSGHEVFSHHIRQAGWDVAWLPRGTYEVVADLSGMDLPEAGCVFKACLWANANAEPRLLGESLSEAIEANAAGGSAAAPAWSLNSADGAVDINKLSWNRGHEDWFFKHFDHAARVIINLMLDGSPLLKGKVLDVGCGDGMTDLGVFLRCQPELLVGIDPSERYALLPEVASSNQLPDDWQDNPRLRFEAADGNAIPYEDDSFDVVLSWGSLEHIKGGYAGTLAEIRRVLKPDGLFFCHPGLYFGTAGNHLGEFFDDPWIHLKLDEETLRNKVVGGRPDYMDRGGEFASPEDYWQWYTELNPITVDGFEKELREMGFEPWRVAVRTCPLVEYTPELQKHSFSKLANRELYVSAWNRK